MPIPLQSRPLQSRTSDLAIRAAGLSLLPVGVLAIRTLYRLAHIAPVHESTPLELGLAALGFVALSLGSLLLLLGAHIFDQVEISPRWATRADPHRKHPRNTTDPWSPDGAPAGSTGMDPLPALEWRRHDERDNPRRCPPTAGVILTYYENQSAWIRLRIVDRRHVGRS